MYRHVANNYNHLIEIIHDLQKSSNFYFRGQKDYTFKLQTRIADKYHEPKEVMGKAKEIIEMFKKKISENNASQFIYLETESAKSFPYITDWYWLFQAQHIGIPTPLLDWSTDWYAPMYFCCVDEPEKEGQLWLFDYTRLGHKISRNPENRYGNEEPIFCKSFWENTFTGFINPSHYVNTYNQAGTENRKGQQALFFIQPYNDNCTPLEEREEFFDYIHLIEISPKVKIQYMQIANSQQKVSSCNEGFRGVTKEGDRHYSEYSKTIYVPQNKILQKIVREIKYDFSFG